MNCLISRAIIQLLRGRHAREQGGHEYGRLPSPCTCSFRPICNWAKITVPKNDTSLTIEKFQSFLNTYSLYNQCHSHELHELKRFKNIILARTYKVRTVEKMVTVSKCSNPLKTDFNHANTSNVLLLF